MRYAWLCCILVACCPAASNDVSSKFRAEWSAVREAAHLREDPSFCVEQLTPDQVHVKCDDGEAATPAEGCTWIGAGLCGTVVTIPDRPTGLHGFLSVREVVTHEFTHVALGPDHQDHEPPFWDVYYAALKAETAD